MKRFLLIGFIFFWKALNAQIMNDSSIEIAADTKKQENFISLPKQSFLWNLTFDGIVDNREYFNPYTMPGTIAATRVCPTVFLNFERHHTLNFGMSYLYEFGSSPDAHKPLPNVHYAYSDSLFEFKIGAFPRRNSVEYPQVLLIDTLNYFDPMIDGAFFGVKSKFGTQYAWLDWLARQTETVSERFLAGTSGKFELNTWFTENYLYIYHKGHSINRTYSHPIRDNAGTVVNVGKRFDFPIKIETKLGYVGSYNRMRPAPFLFAYGAMAQANMRWKIVGLDLLYYYGDPQIIKYGDWFYRSGNYARADAFLLPYESDLISLKVNFAFHYVENTLDMSQLLLLNVNLGGYFDKKETPKK